MVASTPNPIAPSTQFLHRPLPEQRQILRRQMEACRASTLALIHNLSEAEYFSQSHPDFSPVGWHLGHIALIESNWILRYLARTTDICAPYQRLLAADGLPKAERQNLPDLPQVQALLENVRTQVWDYLEQAPVHQQARLWWWLLQHESQHAETICIVLAMHRHNSTAVPSTASYALTPQIHLPATSLPLGYCGIDALDNEQPCSTVFVDDFWIDIHPVTQGQYGVFMAAGGYQHQEWWSPQGWQWLQQQPVHGPRYWHHSADGDGHPVCGVSWYEADAYARWAGRRLPQEAEWERAACWDATGQQQRLYPWGQTWPDASRCNHGSTVGGTTAVQQYATGTTETGIHDLIGNVWEWTATWFDSYGSPHEFQPFPYRGYSQAYFDGQHRVLRGGSWATRPWALRGTLRNWYYPHMNQMLAGFRCVTSSTFQS